MSAMQRGVCFQNLSNGVHSKNREGCAFKMPVGVCIQNAQRGVHSQSREGCASKLIPRGVHRGVCIFIGLPMVNYHWFTPIYVI